MVTEEVYVRPIEIYLKENLPDTKVNTLSLFLRTGLMEGTCPPSLWCKTHLFPVSCP